MLTYCSASNVTKRGWHSYICIWLSTVLFFISYHVTVKGLFYSAYMCLCTVASYASLIVCSSVCLSVWLPQDSLVGCNSCNLGSSGVRTDSRGAKLTCTAPSWGSREYCTRWGSRKSLTTPTIDHCWLVTPVPHPNNTLPKSGCKRNHLAPSHCLKGESLQQWNHFLGSQWVQYFLLPQGGPPSK